MPMHWARPVAAQHLIRSHENLPGNPADQKGEIENRDLGKMLAGPALAGDGMVWRGAIIESGAERPKPKKVKAKAVVSSISWGPTVVTYADERGALDNTMLNGPMDLKEALDSSLSRSNRLHALQEEASAAKSVVWQQITSFVPVVKVGHSATRSYNSTNSAVANQIGLDHAGSVRMSVPLFTSGQRLFNFKSASSSLASADAETEVAGIEVALDTVTAYINYVPAVRISGLIQQNVGTLQRLLAAVEARQKLGFASDTDRAQVKADLNSLQEQLIAAQTTREKARATSESPAGGTLKDAIQLAALQQQLERGEEQFVTDALEHSPFIRSADHVADAARYQTMANISSLLPQVALAGAYNRDYGVAAGGRDRDDWSVQLRTTVPLVDLSSVTEVSRARYLARSASYRATETRRLVELDIRTLWQDYTGAKRQSELAAERVSHRWQVASSLEKQYKIGLVSLDTMLDRQRLLTSAEVELQRIEVERAVSAFRILLTAGTFSTEMLVATE